LLIDKPSDSFQARRSGGSSDTNSPDSDVSGPLTLQDFLKTGSAPLIVSTLVSLLVFLLQSLTFVQGDIQFDQPLITGPLIGERTGRSIGADVMTLEKDVMDVAARGADDIVGRATPQVNLIRLKDIGTFVNN